MGGGVNVIKKYKKLEKVGKSSLQLLHKLFNNQTPLLEWVDRHFKQMFTTRQTKFNAIKTGNYKIASNILTNRLTVKNNKIELADLNMSLDSFKCKYKQILLVP